MIQAIVYDAVGTLIHVRPSVAKLYQEHGRRFGSCLTDAEIQRRFHGAFARQDRVDEQAGWRTDEGRERLRWRHIVTEVLDDVVDPEACFEALFAAFAKPDAWRSDADVATVLTTMHERGYRQAMGSNFDRRLHGVLDSLAPRRLLERVVISSEVGCASGAGVLPAG